VAITIRPLGGLGNQLFVYAAGSTVANKLETELIVDLASMASSPGRKYELDSFGSQISQVTNTFDSIQPSNSKKLLQRLTNAFGGRHVAPTTIKDRGFWFDPRILSAPNGSTLEGYLQSWKYFHADSARLREEIWALSQPTEWFGEWSRKLRSEQPWVGIHVRRGDYLNIPGMGISTNYYYERAINLITQLHGEKSVIVFSDDPELAARLPSIAGLENVEFIVPPSESGPIESLLLMSLASHLIMANSSFSWWAAWLGDSEVRTVIYPRPWIDFRFINDRDLPLPNWIGLGRESPNEALNINVGY
jgi:hypothetical protein